MKIERLEFIGFGNLTGQRLDFAADKISLVVQPNDYGKSTIAEAIWSVLYGYLPWDPDSGEVKPGTARKPLSGAAFKACMDLRLPEASLHLIRQFADPTLTVLDLSKDPSKSGADITSRFAASIACGQFGDALTGLSAQLFRSTCFIEQGQLDAPPFARDRAVSSLLMNVADTDASGYNAFDALAAIEERLAAFPFQGQSYQLDELLQILEDKRRQLELNLQRLESERLSCDNDVDRLSEIEERLTARLRAVNADEYFQLCAEAADIDFRLSRAQERMARILQLQKDASALAAFAHFPTDRQRQVEELWTRRQSRLSDLKRLVAEVESEALHSSMQEWQQPAHDPALEGFTVDDSQTLTALAGSLMQVAGELDEARLQYETETQRLVQIGVNADILRDIRQSMLNLEPRELDDLHAVSAMMVGSRERLSECLNNGERAHHAAEEIAAARGVLQRLFQQAFWPALIMACICLLPLLYMLLIQHHGLSEPTVSKVTLLYLLFCGGSALCWVACDRIKRSYRVSEEEQYRQKENKFDLSARELLLKVDSYEARIQALALKSGLSSGHELIENMQEYALSAPQFKDLDFVEHLLKNNSQHAQKLKDRIEPYLLKRGRLQEPLQDWTPEQLVKLAQEALKLAEEINRTVDVYRSGAHPVLLVRHREPELLFVNDELKDADRLLTDEFARMNLTFNDLDEGYAAFQAAAEGCQRWQTVNSELELLNDESTSDLSRWELPKVVERLESKRTDIWGRLNQLISQYPEMLQMAPPSSEPLISSIGKEMSDLRAAADQLKGERDDLTVQIRAAMKNFQDNHLKMLEELEAVERDCQKVTRVRASLRLARDTMLKMAEENHSVWANRLSDLARQMLSHLGTEYDAMDFDADMTVSARRKGQREPLKEWHILNQVSEGTRQQLYLLSRLAVALLVAGKKQLPLILDEPFCQFDDDRFLRMMRLLIHNVSGHHQVIIFSCHLQRHEWLLQKLDPQERAAVELCRLTPLTAQTGSLARR